MLFTLYQKKKYDDSHDYVLTTYLNCIMNMKYLCTLTSIYISLSLL